MDGNKSTTMRAGIRDRGFAPHANLPEHAQPGDPCTKVIGLFKTEVIRRRGPWRNLEAVEFATLDWVDWYDNRRLLEPIGDMPPAEAEERY